MNNKEYLRLPHGMFDRDSDWIESERLILENHKNCGRRIGCELEKYSPLGYKSSFSREIHTADNKVYELTSKTGKELLLSCDSSPSVLRKYISTNLSGPKRVSFIAPLFRYKNSHNRHFTQIGYSFINENGLNNKKVDYNLVQLSKAMIDLFESMSIPTYIQINNYKALKEIIKKYTDIKDVGRLLYELQFGDIEKRTLLIDETFTDSKKKKELIDMFNMDVQVIEDINCFEKLDLPEEYYEFFDTYNAIKKVTGVDLAFNPSDLHSIETIDDIALRFKTKSGVSLGDGGNYSIYANRWNNKINSFYSVATGVEVIERNKEVVLNHDYDKVAVYSIDASDDFILRSMDRLYEEYDTVSYNGEVRNISKLLKKIQKNYTHFVVLGSNEELKNELEVKKLRSRDSVKIKLDQPRTRIRK